MRKTALLIALFISIFCLSGCLVIRSEEHKHHQHHSIPCEPDK